MDETSIVLGVAIIILVVLIMVCSKDSQFGLLSKDCECHSSSVTKKSDVDDESEQLSTYGSGVKNRQLAEQYNQLANLQGYDDYNSVIKYNALEPEVFDSHDTFSHDIGISNSGASALSIRSDPNDVVPFVGLRRPDYHSTYAGNDARVQHSEYIDQQMAKTTYCV